MNILEIENNLKQEISEKHSKLEHDKNIYAETLNVLFDLEKKGIAILIIINIVIMLLTPTGVLIGSSIFSFLITYSFERFQKLAETGYKIDIANKENDIDFLKSKLESVYLFEDYLNDKTLTREELLKIVTFLYLDFKKEIHPIIENIEKEYETAVVLRTEEENIVYDSRESNIEEFRDTKSLTRTKKR